MRQSMQRSARTETSGATMLEVNSGMKWAIESSSFEMVSTSSILWAPMGVSIIAPSGTCSILRATARRISRRIA